MQGGAEVENKELGNYITKLRLSRGYSQHELAQVLGIGRQAYSHYETGRNIPAYHSIVRLSELYGVSTETFISRMHLSDAKWNELKACYKIVMEHDKCAEKFPAGGSGLGAGS